MVLAPDGKPAAEPRAFDLGIKAYINFLDRGIAAAKKNIEAMEDSEIVFISHKDLNGLYEANANWAKFGRLLAELFFAYAQTRTEEFVFFSHEERYLRLLEEHSNIIERIPSYHISSYLGITNPSLSRIRKRIKK